MKRKNFSKYFISVLLVSSILTFVFFSAPKIFALSDLTQLSQSETPNASTTSNVASLLNIMNNAPILSKLNVDEATITPVKTNILESIWNFRITILSTIGNNLISGSEVISMVYKNYVLPPIKLFPSKMGGMASAIMSNVTVYEKHTALDLAAPISTIATNTVGNNPAPTGNFLSLGNGNLGIGTVMPALPLSLNGGEENIQTTNPNQEDISDVIVPIASNDNSIITAVVADVFGNVKNQMGLWLGDAGNGISNIFAGTITARNELCINTTCVTEVELKELLQNAGYQTK